MGSERNLQIGVFIIDTAVLIAFITGFFKLMWNIAPDVMHGVNNLPLVLLIYIISYAISYFLFPSVIPYRLVKYGEILSRATAACLAMMLFISLFILASRSFPNYFPRTFLFYSIALYWLILVVERMLLRELVMYVRSRKRNQKNIVLIGNEQTVYQLYKILKTPIYGYNIVGIFYDGICDIPEFAQIRLGGVSDIYSWLSKNSGINEIYGYFPREQREIINMMSKFCDNHLIRFYYIPAINVFKGNMTISFMGGIPIIARREEPLRQIGNQILKRAFDIIFSSLILTLLFPWILLWVAIMIKRQSPGPIFFKQERTGLDGKVFTCLKFRSMKMNDEANEMQATKDDPRKFPFGDFMRKTNIDELPQFINVFRGDMSVVGPRPHMLKHTSEYSKLISRFMVRHFAKPGITGLAQVSGFRGETRYIDQMEGRVKKDIEYIENWSFLLDIKIILKTITNMFGREKGNAY